MTPPSPSSCDSWESISDEHAKITWWRDAWKRAEENRKPPWLATVKESIEARWDRANQRMARCIHRADTYRNPENVQVELPAPDKKS